MRMVDYGPASAAGRTNASAPVPGQAHWRGRPARPVGKAVSAPGWYWADIDELQAWWARAKPGECFAYANAAHVDATCGAPRQARALYDLGLAELALRRGPVTKQFLYLIIKRREPRVVPAIAKPGHRPLAKGGMG